MKKVILHIGFGKTGSSYLQSCFARSADRLLEHGIQYPDGGTNRAAGEGKITSGNAVRLAKYLNPRNALNVDVTGFEDELDRMLQETRVPTLLFSSEFLANFNAEQMLHFKAFLLERGFSLYIVCYLRSIAGHAYSNYSQRVKRHLYTQDFYDYLQQHYQMPFRGLLKRIEACFAPGSYSIRNYDEVRDCLWEDFSAGVLGLEGLGGLEKQVVNRSLDCFELEFMKVFNRYLSDERHAAHVSNALIYADHDRPVDYVLEPRELELLADKYAEPLAFINRFLADDQPLSVVGPEFVEGGREKPVLDRFQQALISVMAASFVK